MSEKANIGVVTCRTASGGVKLWHVHERQEREVPGLNAELGMWFKIKSDTSYEPLAVPPIETRCRDQLVEVLPQGDCA